MRILLQQIGSGLYLKRDGWTKTPDEALVFPSAEMARGYSYDEGLSDTFVVLLPNAHSEPLPDNVINLQNTQEWNAKDSERREWPTADNRG